MPKLHTTYQTKKKGPTPGKERRRGAKPYCKSVAGQPIKGKSGGKY